MSLSRNFAFDPEIAPDDQTKRIRLWFKCLKSAYRVPELQADLSASSKFYEPWGDVRHSKFERWWPDHDHLFCPTLSNGSAVWVLPYEISASLSFKEAMEAFTHQFEEFQQLLTPARYRCEPFRVDIREHDFNVYRLTKAHDRMAGKTERHDILHCIDNDMISRELNGEFDVKAPHPLAMLNIDEDNYDSVRKALQRAQLSAESMISAAAKGSFPGMPRNEIFRKSKR